MTVTAAGFAIVDQVENHRLPSWLRVTLWCWAHAHRERGHARAYPRQLRQALGPGTTARDVSRAIRQARARGLIDHSSNASCLVLPGYGGEPCDAQHRGGTR